MKKKIIFHIGHGKTGSSALQSFLALNTDLLKKNGIFYPVFSKNFYSRQLKGLSSSGNLGLINPEQTNQLSNFISDNLKNNNVVLFSSEGLYRHISYLSKTSLKEFFVNHEIEIILFVRNPLDFLSSSYIQNVKANGLSKNLDEWILERDKRFIKWFDQIMQIYQLNNRKNVTLKIINYSKSKNIFKDFLKKLDIVNIDEFKIPAKKINRSINGEELQFLKILNKINRNGMFASFISNYFFNIYEIDNIKKKFFSNKLISKGLIIKINSYIDISNHFLKSSSELNLGKLAMPKCSKFCNRKFFLNILIFIFFLLIFFCFF